MHQQRSCRIIRGLLQLHCVSCQVLNGQCSSQKICYVIPCSCESRLLRKQPRCWPGSHRLASSSSGLDNPHLGKALVQVVLPAELSFSSLSTSFPGTGTQKHSCGDLPVTGHLPDRPLARSQQGALLEPPLAVTVLCCTPRHTARKG